MVRASECELCGHETSRLYRREVEGVIMYLCDQCKGMGKIPRADVRKKRQKDLQSRNTSKFKTLYSDSEDSKPTYRRTHDRPAYSAKSRLEHLKVVDNAAQILLRLRTKQGMSPREFAKSVLIKETYYRRIEKGSTALPVDIARKFEKKYHIKLVEKESDDMIEDVSKFLKKGDKGAPSMVYFRKRGEKPDYDQ